MKHLILSAVLLILMAACTSNEPSATTASTTSGGATETPPTVSTTTSIVDTQTTANDLTETTTTSISPESEGPTYIEGIVIPKVTLLTAASGGGERPLLQWEPVEGAAWYQAIVLTSSGETYWSWPTQETEVYVSGVESAGERSPGPRISQGMVWAVLAFDDANLLIAQSDRRPIDP